MRFCFGADNKFLYSLTILINFCYTISGVIPYTLVAAVSGICVQNWIMLDHIEGHNIAKTDEVRQIVPAK